MGKKAIGQFVSVWMTRLEFANRVLNVPKAVIGQAMLFSVFCKMFGISVTFIKWTIAVGVVLYVLLAWVLDKTQIRQKWELESAKRSGQWTWLFGRLGNEK